MRRKGNPHSQLVGLQISTATTENSLQVSQKIKKKMNLRSLHLTHTLQTQLSHYHLDSPSVSLPFFIPPQQFQTSSIPLTCPTQSHTASPLSSYSCRLEKKEKYQPQAIYPTARPAPPPADLCQEAKANLSTKTLQLIYSAFSGTSTSLLIPYHQHLNIFPQKPSEEVMIFFSQFLINPKR